MSILVKNGILMYEEVIVKRNYSGREKENMEECYIPDFNGRPTHCTSGQIKAGNTQSLQ